MKKILTLFTGVLLGFMNIFAQIHDGKNGNFNPDSLIAVTLTGSAILDSNGMHVRYYLDENGDGMADYHLNFGPHWYSPDSSEAVRPGNGDQITIIGGMHESFDSLNVVVVYQINGDFWREPFEPFWNNFSKHPRMGHHFANGFKGFAFGWRQDSLETVSLTGTALVDTTFFMKHYYLDVNSDGYPDYFLNFGPYWYEPVSGAVRPGDGDLISLTGGLIDRDSLDAVVVYELNGLTWADSTSFRKNIGGRWFHKNSNRSERVFNPFDRGDNFTVNPGWHMGGGMGGGMMDDSLFGQMLELYPQNIPNARGQNAVCGYEIGLYNESGNNLMWQNGHAGGRMKFNSEIKYQFHYSDNQLNMVGADENNIVVKYWDDENNEWQTVNDSKIDATTNTVSFSSADASSLIILSAESVTGVKNELADNIATSFILEQNYPNPFNPISTIKYQIVNLGHVNLTVYNMLGEELMVLVNEELSPGSYHVQVDGSNLASGVYLYKLTVNEYSSVKKLTLIK